MQRVLSMAEDEVFVFLKTLTFCDNAAVEEDSYTKEETKTSKFVNLVHAASLNQPGGSTTPLNAPSAEPLSSACSGFDQVEMDEELNDAQGWPSLSNNAWSKQQSTFSESQVRFQNAFPLSQIPGSVITFLTALTIICT